MNHQGMGVTPYVKMPQKSCRYGHVPRHARLLRTRMTLASRVARNGAISTQTGDTSDTAFSGKRGRRVLQARSTGHRNEVPSIHPPDEPVQHNMLRLFLPVNSSFRTRLLPGPQPCRDRRE